MRNALKKIGWSSLPLAFAFPAYAQQVDDSAQATAASPSPDEEFVEFSADDVDYDSQAEIVTASGRVRMNRDGQHLAADQIIWNRRTGQVQAIGKVVVVNPQGDKLVSEQMTLKDDLKSGTIENLLVVLDSGGRIAARQASQSEDGVTVLKNAVYTPCSVTGKSGCSHEPSWKITAARVTRDADGRRLRFEGGKLSLFGIQLPLLPIFSIGTGGDGGGASGALFPDIAVSNNNGLELSLPYYFRLAPNSDLTLTPRVYSKTNPAIEGHYRQLTSLGAYQLRGFLSYSRVQDPDPDAINPDTRRDIRAYFEANGRFQFDPYWSLTGSLRAASDKTVLRRYDISRDDVLRSFLEVERIKPNSYISISAWGFQGLRVDDELGEIPFALPAIDARFLINGPVADSQLEIRANSLAIVRWDGQDTQRAFASAQWDLRRITTFGQEFVLTAFGRADVYHTDETAKTAVVRYAGDEGWHFRGIGALAAEMKWPFIGPAFGGTQRLTPRVQLVITPPTQNLSIPNEDARGVDLEDSNLFALNRFPGHDRWEDGSRVTYGFEWSLDRPNVSINTIIGQSYRLTRKPSIFPDGTGLTDRFSDIVGRTRIRFGNFVDLTHRFRLDKDNFSPRRNEIDLTVGTNETYALIGYLRLDRDIDPTLEELRDKEELRLAGRVKFADYWSVFGSTVIDLTGKSEDPLVLADGYEPVRHRLGLTYEDECLELGVSWKRDYERIGEFRKGNTFALRLRLKGFGR